MKGGGPDLRNSFRDRYRNKIITALKRALANLFNAFRNNYPFDVDAVFESALVNRDNGNASVFLLDTRFGVRAPVSGEDDALFRFCILKPRYNSIVSAASFLQMTRELCIHISRKPVGKIQPLHLMQAQKFIGQVAVVYLLELAYGYVLTGLEFLRQQLRQPFGG